MEAEQTYPGKVFEENKQIGGGLKLREHLLSLKNKEFVYECLSVLVNKQRKEDLERLTDQDFCKHRFDMNYAILQKVPLVGSIPKEDFLDHCGHRRYYPHPVNAFGNRYIVCNDWYYETQKNNRDTRTSFLNWVINR